jgi:2OG-Fe(II) oxygenase superfamily/SEC-C motif
VTIRVSRNSQCVCGSGKRFKNCCGQDDPPHWNSTAVGRISGSLLDPANAHLIANEKQCDAGIEDLPPGIFVKTLSSDYNWQEYRDALLSTAAAREAAIVRNGQLVRDPQRVTSIVDQGEYTDKIAGLVQRAYCGPIQDFFESKLRWFEQPQILRYQPGGFYRTHSDADSWVKAEQAWKRTLDRDLSLLIYLDDNYTGGELIFPNFNFRFRPQAGVLLAFPADYRYLHGAMPVISGVRHAIVSWSSVSGVERVNPAPPDTAIMVNG